MPGGMEVYNDDMSLAIGITDRLGMTLGTVRSGLSNGSITNSALGEGEPWFTATCIPSGSEMAVFYPSITISGGVLSWVFSSANQSEVYISYGIF